MLAIEKFIEFVRTAMGYALEPRHRRRLADSTAYEIDAVASAIVGAREEGVEVEFVDGKIAARSLKGRHEEPLTLPERSAIRATAESVREQENIEEILVTTYEELQDNETVSDMPVDADWATAYIHSARMISDDMVRVLFGKILAGEIKEPGSYGIRTIETLRNMSKKEAELFQKMASLVVRFQNNLVIPRVDTVLFHEFDVNDETFIVLGEMGLLSENLLVQLNYACGPQNPIHIVYGDSLVTTAVESDTHIKPPIFRITSVGMELYALTQPKIHRNYVSSVIAAWGRTMRIPLNVGRITKIEGGRIYSTDITPLV